MAFVADVDDDISPVAAITAPAAGVEISAEVDIVGTAADDNLTGWTLRALAEDGSVLAEIAAGTDPVDGVLGTLATANVPPVSSRCASTSRTAAATPAASTFR